jgi:tetrahydromethanopterin S-methyltransferase subunit G
MISESNIDSNIFKHDTNEIIDPTKLSIYNDNFEIVFQKNLILKNILESDGYTYRNIDKKTLEDVKIKKIFLENGDFIEVFYEIEDIHTKVVFLTINKNNYEKNFEKINKYIGKYYYPTDSYFEFHRKRNIKKSNKLLYIFIGIILFSIYIFENKNILNTVIPAIKKLFN